MIKMLRAKPIAGAVRQPSELVSGLSPSEEAVFVAAGDAVSMNCTEVRFVIGTAPASNSDPHPDNTIYLQV